MEDKVHHFSLLDLSPIPEGATASDALHNTLDLARLAEEKGYHRYWLAEHHNMPCRVRRRAAQIRFDVNWVP